MDKWYYRYWGKLDDKHPGVWHCAVYHCLETAAVASVLWDKAPGIRRLFGDDSLKPWVLFYHAVHDLAKIDPLFQTRNPIWRTLFPDFGNVTVFGSISFLHGLAGYHQLKEYIEELTWIQAVMGHHGTLPRGNTTPFSGGRLENQLPWQQHAHQARLEFLHDLWDLFLTPLGIPFGSSPPVVAPLGLPGLCTLSDWIASGQEGACFDLCSDPVPLPEYYARVLERAVQVVEEKNICPKKLLPVKGFGDLFPGWTARGLQTIVDDIDVSKPVMVLLEDTTGEGKTEAAITLAARILQQGTSDGILFALPTQATCDEMWKRLMKVLPRLFPDGSLMVVHGRSKLLQKAPKDQSGIDLSAFASAWLLTSTNKAGLLAQISVCTVDQALLSVLQSKHHFVRGLAVHRQVFILDEVHSYDSYMTPLNGQILSTHLRHGGSSVVCSATLASKVKRDCITMCGFTPLESEPQAFPLATICTQGTPSPTYLRPKTRIRRRWVKVECLRFPLANDIYMGLPASLDDRILTAAKKGQKVGIILNTVQDVQVAADWLKQKAATLGLSFKQLHSRYTHSDRTTIQNQVMFRVGTNPDRDRAGIIVLATQVIEQSVNLDFDWLITQICPIDLLIQRIGRLWRTRGMWRCRSARALVTVLLPEGESYGEANELIYGCKALLWRTQKILEQTPILYIPSYYRRLVEYVYAGVRPDEPAEITKSVREAERDAKIDRFKAENRIMSYLPVENTIPGAALLTRGQGHRVAVMLLRDQEHLWTGEPLFDDAGRPDFLAVSNCLVNVPRSWQIFMSYYRGMGKKDGLDGQYCLVLPYRSDIGTITYRPDEGLRLRRSKK